ncbi:16S rRNA (cytosine(1402)-N(4))-methyltransferase RsmH [bacterium]|nr:16S rRNA (cytosine(1402)-N(4))-methyltransferase RsmH [bacterium]
MTDTRHISVLSGEAIQGLGIRRGDVILDATLGGGGHSEEICEKIGKEGTLIAIDIDSGAIERAKKRLSAKSCKKEYIQGNFRQITEHLHSRDIKNIDGALFDLGLSSDQLEQSGRGFSFQREEPLIMTLNDNPEEHALTAEEIVNDWDEENIAAVIAGFGGERYAKSIARHIAEARLEHRITTTTELVRIIEKSVPAWYRHKRIHFATKTFQALRIAVNDELGALSEGLRSAFEALRVGGRIAVISFHEHEDRIVKHFLRDLSRESKALGITKKPITPSYTEIKNNPRARSAKLRIAEKTA